MRAPKSHDLKVESGFLISFAQRYSVLAASINMSEKEEKKHLIEGGGEPYGSASPPPGASYGAEKKRPENGVLAFLYDHRASIPGYGMLQMLKQSSVYSLYVLAALLLAYLLNQLDRYTLPIVTSSSGYDLRYGDLSCMKNRHISKHMFEEYDITKNITSICSNDSYIEGGVKLNVKGNSTLCTTLDILTFYDDNDTEHNVCEYAHTGAGLTYQIVAGPVFNNLYIFAGIFTGFLADYGRRTLWLVLSLFFWSVATGLTGFAREFWHLVVLRALLAIGAAGCSPFAVSIIGDYFPDALRGTAIGIYYWGVYIGYSLAFAIGNGIEQVLNWRWVFFLSAIIGIVAAPLILFTVKEPKRRRNLIADSESTEIKLSFWSRLLLLIRTFIMPGMFFLCLASGVRNAGGYVWAYNTELFFEANDLSRNQISKFMSWIPLVGGSIGAVVGGIISDMLVKGRSPYMRVWVLIVSQILAAPFAAGALFLPYPWCFLSLIPSNVIGEMWIGVASAIIVDLAPSKIRTAVIAVYLFIITVIGGNFNLLVPPIHHGFKQHFSDLASYRWSLFLTFPGVYALSSLLFVLAFFLMRLDLKHKMSVEQRLVVNQPKDPEESEEDVGENGELSKDKPDEQGHQQPHSHLETSYSESEHY